MRWIAIAVALLALAGGTAAAPSAPKPILVARVGDLIAGPVFAGNAVVWGEHSEDRRATVKTAANGQVRTVYSSDAPPTPPPETGYRAYWVRDIAAVAASASAIAFIQTDVVRYTPRCAPACRDPGFTRLLASELWVRTNGRLRRLARGDRRASSCKTWPRAVAVSGRQVVYVDDPAICDHPGVTEAGRGSTVVAVSVGGRALRSGVIAA